MPAFGLNWFMHYEISRKASAVIDDIIRYTDKNFGPDQTATYVGGLYNSFDILADNPRLGRRFTSDKKRLYIYRSHYVLYRIMDSHVLITDIRNTRQQIPDEWRK